MSNRCYIDFDEPNRLSPSTWLYEGSMADDEDDVSFCFEGPAGLLDRVKAGEQAAINELMGRIYMGTQGPGQDMMEFHWSTGIISNDGLPDLQANLPIDQVTGVVFAEHARRQMEQDTSQPSAHKPSPRM